MEHDDVFETKIQDIKNSLAEYVLEECDEATQHTSGDVVFRCVNPDHNDNNPSMFVGHEVPHVAYCRSCKAVYNIFQIHNILHGAPMHGVQFIQDNVNALALKLDVDPVDLSDISEEQLFKMKAFQIVDVASSILGDIANPRYDKFVSHVYSKQLHITDEVLKEMRIGTITNVNLFFNEIKLVGGWTTEDLENAGLRTWLFKSTQVTYTICNPQGFPVAFGSRNLDYDGRFGVTKSTTQEAKWVNSNVSLIYKKTNILYGISQARKTKAQSVYIFEGYADVCVAYSYGIRNAVCVGSSSFSPTHAKMLVDRGFSNCVIALDSDEAGLKGVDNVLKKGFSVNVGLKPTILLVPPTPKQDGSGKIDNDPDSYIHLYGADAFKSIKPKSTFRYTVDRIPDDLDTPERQADFLERFLPIIADETNVVTREQMQVDIATRIKVPVTTVKESLARREQMFNMDNRNQIKKEFKGFYGRFNDAVDINPGMITSVVNTFNSYVEERMNSDLHKAIGIGEVTEGFDNWFEGIQTTVLDNLFWKTGNVHWDNTIGGVKKTGNFTGLTGPSNVGKSAFLMNLAVGILENNDPDELLMLYWTIDDPREDTLTKMAAINCELPISKISDFKNLKSPDQSRIRKFAGKLKKCIEVDKCFAIKDMSIGNSPDDLIRWVDAEKAKQPHKKILIIIDNFANMSYVGDELTGQVTNINKLHALRVKNNIAIFSSFEVNKEGSAVKSGAKAMYGSGKLQYRLTLNLFLWNEVDIIRTQNIKKTARDFWMDSRQEMMPIVDISLIKKKMTFKDDSFNGTIYFRFINYVGKMNEIGAKSAWELFKTENAGMQHTKIAWNFKPPNTRNYISPAQLTDPSDNQNDDLINEIIPTPSISEVEEL